jgi:NitT/TauT family transport system substrate-binding protein
MMIPKLKRVARMEHSDIRGRPTTRRPRISLPLDPGYSLSLLPGLIAACLLAPGAFAADTVRIAVQATGTLAWELDVIAARGLDRDAELKIETVQLASPEAGKIALRGGSVDVIVSDWLWVSRERQLGADLAFHPYSSALGAVMVPAGSPIKTLADLKGRKLAVAGGPIDKSWLLLLAAMKQDGVDLKTQATVVYGAPALLAEKTLLGEMDATLNYWNLCAALEAKGFRRLAGVEDILPKLGVSGRPALLGYVFAEGWAVKNRAALARFLDATRKAKEILAHSDAEWERIAPLVKAADANALTIYRDRYREGIPRRPIDEEERDARVLYRVLAQIGGSELIGSGDLAPGTFHRPAGN